MNTFIFWTLFAAATVLPFAIPPAVIERSWKRFFIATFQVTFGMTLPLATFYLSGALAPEWKGECRREWLDCFHVTKLYLSPLVLWACVAFYRMQVLKQDGHCVITVGLCLGFLVSAISSVIGLLINNCYSELEWGLAIPFYTAIWYGILWWKNKQNSQNWKWTSFFSALGSIPFWMGVVYASKKQYLALPDEPQGCFVVTAASSGHPTVVGPFTEIEHRGKPRLVNEQLATFWEFEDHWAKTWPTSHAAFRNVYNRLGPVIASRMGNVLLADVVFLCLKPLEWIASSLIHRIKKES